MSSETILIVDDEPAIRHLLRSALHRAGHAVIEAADAGAALAAIDREPPAAVLLDLGLPDREGIELIPLIKAKGPALIVVSAREATAEKIAALDLGADDYITKPFDTEEMLARIRTALRQRGRSGKDSDRITLGDVTIDLAARSVTRAGSAVHLRPKEYDFLAELARQPGRVVTHAQLLRAIWGAEHELDLEYLRVAARGVRIKLEADPSAPTLIRNEPAVGYRLVDPAL